MRAAWLSALVVVGCGVEQLPPEEMPTDDPTARAACTALEGLTFRSVEPGECGLTPDGVAMCHWSIAFGSAADDWSTYAWTYSDVGESGTIRCDETGIHDDGGRTLGRFDDQTLSLEWDGTVYEIAP